MLDLLKWIFLHFIGLKLKFSHDWAYMVTLEGPS